MDPDAALARLRALMTELEHLLPGPDILNTSHIEDAAAEVVEAWEALDGWLSKDGAPSDSCLGQLDAVIPHCYVARAGTTNPKEPSMTTSITAISVDQFLTRHDTEIFAGEVNDRIHQLKEEIDEAHENGDDHDALEDLTRERDQLVAFRDEVELRTGDHFDSATIVPEDLFTEHARSWAEGVADIDFLAPFVDWDCFADSLKDGYTELEFGDDTVYVK
jgi:hypothetical protein